MSWSKLDVDKETMYNSDATSHQEVYRDLTIVIERMLANKTADEADDAAAILFYTNATNGYIKAMWYNSETERSIGKFIYYLELKTLWEMSLAHEDGAFFFDNEAHIGICCSYEDFIDIITVYTSTEMNSTAEELYI